MSVHILNEQLLYVMPSSNLVLKARINQGPLEEISSVIWERESESGVGPQKVTLVTCYGRNLDCVATRPNVRVSVSVKQQEMTLQISGYTIEDRGVYGVTLTDQRGTQSTSHCIVRMYGTV